jgi:hypothetical protein
VSSSGHRVHFWRGSGNEWSNDSNSRLNFPSYCDDAPTLKNAEGFIGAIISHGERAERPK